MSEIVPEGWKVVPIGNATKFSQGIQVDVEQHYERKDNSKVRFVRISDYTKFNEPPRYIDNKVAAKGLVDKDDIVMIRYGEAGRVCRGIVGAIANNLFTIRPNNLLGKEYLFQYLSAITSGMYAVMIGVIEVKSKPWERFQLILQVG